jgi:hypothetical protein
MSRDTNVGRLVKDFALGLIPPTPPQGGSSPINSYEHLALGDSIPFFVHRLVLTDTPPDPIEVDLLGISPVDPIV